MVDGRATLLLACLMFAGASSDTPVQKACMVAHKYESNLTANPVPRYQAAVCAFVVDHCRDATLRVYLDRYSNNGIYFSKNSWTCE